MGNKAKISRKAKVKKFYLKQKRGSRSEWERRSKPAAGNSEHLFCRASRTRNLHPQMIFASTYFQVLNGNPEHLVCPDPRLDP
jgi:hypothetical protein